MARIKNTKEESQANQNQYWDQILHIFSHIWETIKKPKDMKYWRSKIFLHPIEKSFVATV